VFISLVVFPASFGFFVDALTVRAEDQFAPAITVSEVDLVQDDRLILKAQRDVLASRLSSRHRELGDQYPREGA
jgi:hypothetical protein